MRVLIAHASIGSGHKAAASAIHEALASSHPEWEVAVIDTVETSEVNIDGETHSVEPSKKARESKTKFLHMREVMPRITDKVVDAGDHDWSVKRTMRDGMKVSRDTVIDSAGRITRKLQRATGVVKPGVYYLKSFAELLEKVRFDLLISTHFYSAHALAMLKDDEEKEESVRDTLSFVVVTDYHAHKIWKCRHVNKYFLPSPQVDTEVFGWFPSQKEKKPPTVISGIPVSPKIGKVARIDKFELRKSLGLPHRHESKVVLATLSSENIADSKLAFSHVVAWAKKNPDHFVVLVAGRLARERLEKDEAGKKKLAKNKNVALDDAGREMARGLPNVLVVGFTSQMAEYMHASDIIVSKPGGLTVAESLAFGLAWMIVKPWLLDVERPNAAYLQDMEIAKLVDNVSQLDPALQTVVQVGVDKGKSSDWLVKAQASARSLGLPEAAMTVVRSAESALASSTVVVAAKVR